MNCGSEEFGLCYGVNECVVGLCSSLTVWQYSSFVGCGKRVCSEALV